MRPKMPIYLCLTEGIVRKWALREDTAEGRDAQKKKMSHYSRVH